VAKRRGSPAAADAEALGRDLGAELRARMPADFFA